MLLKQYFSTNILSLLLLLLLLLLPSFKRISGHLLLPTKTLSINYILMEHRHTFTIISLSTLLNGIIFLSYVHRLFFIEGTHSTTALPTRIERTNFATFCK
jgi:hypothetical protein